MARRKLLDVTKLPLVGGAPGLDLVNTTGARASSRPRERLESYDDLVVWARRAGILRGSTRAGGDALKDATRRAAVQRVRDAREVLYSVLSALAEQRRPSATALHQLDRLCREDRLRRRLAIESGVISLQAADATLADRVISAALDSTMALIGSRDHLRIRRCAECDWLFLDRTKNQSRLWCKTSCGDRVRARRHYARGRKR